MVISKTVQLYKNYLLSDAGTNTLPLKRNDMIVGLNVKIRAQNGATSNIPDAAAETGHTPEASVTKLEVRSGSAIFKSYTGEICRKIATYRNGFLPERLESGVVGGTWAGSTSVAAGWKEASFPIDFCIKQDPLGNRTNTIMPAPLYDSLDLVIDTSFTIAATGFATGTVYADVYAETLPKQDAVSMQNKRILVEAKKADYTTLASGDEQFPLTLDPNRSLRHLYVDCYETGIVEGVDITDMTLKVEGDSYRSGKWTTYQEQNARDCNLRYVKTYFADAGDASVVYYTRVPAAEVSLTMTEPPADAAHVAYGSTLADQVTVVNDSGESYYMKISSPVLPAMAVMDFDKDGLGQNMQYQGVRDLELNITNGGAGGTMQVIEQSVCKPWGF